METGIRLEQFRFFYCRLIDTEIRRRDLIAVYTPVPIAAPKCPMCLSTTKRCLYLWLFICKFQLS